MSYKHDKIEDNPYLVYTEESGTVYEPAEDADEDNNNDGD